MVDVVGEPRIPKRWTSPKAIDKKEANGCERHTNQSGSMRALDGVAEGNRKLDRRRIM